MNVKLPNFNVWDDPRRFVVVLSDDTATAKSLDLLSIKLRLFTVACVYFWFVAETAVTA